MLEQKTKKALEDVPVPQARRVREGYRKPVRVERRENGEVEIIEMERPWYIRITDPLYWMFDRDC